MPGAGKRLRQTNRWKRGWDKLICSSETKRNEIMASHFSERLTKAAMALDTITGSFLTLCLSLLLSRRYIHESKTSSSNCFGEKKQRPVYVLLQMQTA